MKSEERFKLLRAKLPDGFSLNDSGQPRGEPRWYHLVNQNGRTVVESTDLRTIERRIDKINSTVRKPGMLSTNQLNGGA